MEHAQETGCPAAVRSVTSAIFVRFARPGKMRAETINWARRGRQGRGRVAQQVARGRAGGAGMGLTVGVPCATSTALEA